MHMLLYLILLTTGVLAFVRGLYVTRLTWRRDIMPYHLLGPTLTMTLQIARHPERFAGPERLSEIRLTNLVAAALLSGALLVVLYDIAAGIALSLD